MNRLVIAVLCTVLTHVGVLVVPLHFSPSAPAEDPVITLHFRAVEPRPKPIPPEPEPLEEPPALDPPPPPKPIREPPPEPPPPAQVEPAPEPPPPAAPAEPAPEPAAAPIDPSQLARVEAPSQVLVKPRPEPRSSRPSVRRAKVDLRSYAREMRAAFLRHRRYPPAALRLQLNGTAKVKVAVDRQGNLVGSPTLVRSTGHAVLDEEALRVVKVAAPFSPLPIQAEKDVMVFVIPIDFSVGGS